MNDFTKEELEELKGWMIEAEAEHSVYPEKKLASDPLYNKIQSMIDNYFEIKTHTVDKHVCGKCNEEWRLCECK